MSKPVIDTRRSVPATPTDDAWPDGGYTAPGSVFIDTDEKYKGHLTFACPGCGSMGAIRIGREKTDPPSWKIESGDTLKPETITLSPSIHCIGCCGWHGYLKNGVFASC